MPPGLAGGSLAPLALPLVFSGFDPKTFEWARGIFSSMRFAPVMGTAHAGSVPGPLPDLEAGGPVGISLVAGDLDLSVTGTITHIEGDRVYAFGHPFYNLGPTQFPMRKAYVCSVFPSLYQSWKISVPQGEPVGTIEQDRATAVAGRLGRQPRMIPVEIRLGTSRGQQRSFSFRMVEDERVLPRAGVRGPRLRAAGARAELRDPVHARLMLFNDISHYADQPLRPQKHLSRWWDTGSNG